MTAREAALIRRLRRRAARMEPALQRAYLKGLDRLERAISTGTLERLVRAGDADALARELYSDAEIKAAFAEYQRATLEAVRQATEQAAADLPAQLQKAAAAAGGIRFDMLNPRVIDAVRRLDDRMMRGLQESIRETVRAQVEAGLQAGINPRTVARHLDIGLAPNQAKAVENYRAALESGNAAKALSYKLRDARFDKSTVKGGLSKERIDKMVAAYRRRMHAFNAETQARTASLNAARLGQHLSIEDAIDKGVYKREKLFKTWHTVGDSRVREEHAAVDHETVRYDEAFSTGEMIPGENSWNCRCSATYSEHNPVLVERSEMARKQALTDKGIPIPERKPYWREAA